MRGSVDRPALLINMWTRQGHVRDGRLVDPNDAPWWVQSPEYLDTSGRAVGFPREQALTAIGAYPRLLYGVSEDSMNASLPELTMAAHRVTTTAPAKINLTLDVLGRRDDGFHDLRSLVIGVDLSDRVSCRDCDKPGIDLTCSDHSLVGPENLVFRAVQVFTQHVGRAPAVRIELEKNIPIGAGMGGGSSDAAAMLRLCNELWCAGLDDAALANLGSDLGSDVPLFFSLPSAVITGRGERVEPVALRWSGWVLLVYCGVAVPTTDVYQAWRAADSADLPCGTDGAISEATSAKTLTELLSNHLEPAVFRVAPTVAGVSDRLDRAGVGPMRVTGAGSTLYQLFDEKEAACRAARQVEDLRMSVTASVVAAPVGSASVLSEEF